MNQTKVRGITELRDYGKIEIKLKTIMDAKGVSIYQMSKLTGLKHNTIKSYYTNAPLTRIDLDVVAKLCYVLDCSVDDIIEYIAPQTL